MQLLADVSRPPTLGTAASIDSVGLGPIRNPYVRRRDRRNAAPKVAAEAPEPAKTKPAPVKLAPAEKVKEEPKTDSKASSKESTPTPSGAKKPVAKRGASGGIMQSFAKAATMPKKANKPTPAASAEETNIQDLALSDDGEDDSLAMPEPEEETEAARKSRQDRQNALKRMMEESSEDEEPEKEDTPMDDAEEEPPAPEPEAKEDTEPAEVVSSTGGGKRRGKRQVMKKKTVMDEQGYLGMSCVSHIMKSTFCLLNASYCPGKRLGVILRGRASANVKEESRNSIAASENEKGSPKGPRKHHVVLQQEVVTVQFELLLLTRV